MCKIREMNLETAKYYGYEAQSNQLVEEWIVNTFSDKFF